MSISPLGSPYNVLITSMNFLNLGFKTWSDGVLIVCKHWWYKPSYISIENTRSKPHFLRFRGQRLLSSNIFIHFIRTLYGLPEGEMDIFLWVGNQFWSIAIHFGPFLNIWKKTSVPMFTSCLEAFLEFSNFNKLI